MTVKKYSIYLGSPHDELVACNIVQKLFDGFTVFNAVGYWRGKAEDTQVFEIVTDVKNASLIKSVCSELRNRFSQDCVLLVTSDVIADFVED